MIDLLVFVGVFGFSLIMAAVSMDWLDSMTARR